MKLMQVDDSLARKHYAEHSSRPFFANLVMFLSSSPVVAMVWEADAAIEVVRNTMGPTNPAESPMGTIRGDMALDIGRNLVHGSDSVESAAREVALFFSPNEILEYDRTTDIWTKEA
jgi:nucleoside-diphosphate kinase